MSGSLFSRAEVNGEFFLQIGANAYLDLVDRMALRTPSTAVAEQYTFAKLPPRPEVRWGKTILEPVSGKEITITNLEFESGILYKERDLKRDKTGTIRRQTGLLVEAFAPHQFRLIADLINAGDGTSLGLAYDGQNFFDTDHSFHDSGTVNNDLTASELAALNVASTASVTPEEAADIMVGMASQIAGFKGSNGEPMNEMERDFVLVANTAHAGFRTAANANNLASGETNPVRAFQGDGFTIRVLLSSRITATTKVYMFATGSSVQKPFIVQEEEGVRLEVQEEGSTFWFENNAGAAKAKWTGNAGFGEYAKACMGTLS